jgi:hypothetical protein
MATAFFRGNEARGFVRSCCATTLTPSGRKDRVPPVSPRRWDSLSLVAPALVGLVLLDAIGCSTIFEKTEPEQQIQWHLDMQKEAARMYERKQNWAGYAMTLNNIGVDYRWLAERNVEPAQNLQRSLDALKEAAARDAEEKDWIRYAKAQNNLGLTYQVLARRGIEPENNFRLATEAFKAASAH